MPSVLAKSMHCPRRFLSDLQDMASQNPRSKFTRIEGSDVLMALLVVF